MLHDAFTCNRSRQHEDGATSVEFAVVASLLFIILFGIIEYAMIFVQEHYVANAAREAVRIGVRANNYNGYKTRELPTVSAGDYTAAGDRELVVQNAVADYLNVLYDEDDARNGTSVLTEDLDGDLTTDTDRVLIVTVEVDNLMTNITPRLLRVFNPDSTVDSPDIIRFSAQMELEDPEEFDSTNL